MIGAMLLTLVALLFAIAMVRVVRFVLLYREACKRRPEITVVPSFLGIGMLAMLGDVLFPEKLAEWLPFFRASDFNLFSRAAWVEDGRKDVLCIVSMFPLCSSYTVANADLAHELVEGDTVQKQTEAYVVLEFFGRNIVTSQGDEWRKHRKICTGAFTKSNLRLVKQATTRQLSEMTRSWDAAADDKGEVVVKLGGSDDYTRMTLGVFGEAIFGAEMDVFGERARDVASLDTFCTRLMFSTSNLHVAMLVPKWLKRWPFTFFENVDKTLQRMDTDMLEMLMSARRGEGEACKDLLSLLSRSNQRSDPLTEREAVADVWMFCVAGMETSAHTLGWLTMRMAFHADVQQKLFEECSKIDDPEEITVETAPYVFAVMHEVLRLHPAVNDLPLLALKPLTAGPLAGLDVGTQIYMSLEKTHLNPKHFKDPERFDPDRFIVEGQFHLQPGFVAFNIGPRACIGKQVAAMEIAVAVAVLVTTYQIFPVLSHKLSSKWVSKISREFREPTPFRFVRRNKSL